MLFRSRLTAPIYSVLLLVAVFIQTHHDSHAWNSGTRQSKLPSGKLLPGNLEHLLMSYRHQATEDPIVSHRSSRHAADYGNLTELWDFIQSDNISSMVSTHEHLAPRTSDSTTPEYNYQMAPLRTIKGVRSGEIAPTVRRRKRQFEKFTQHVDEATFKSYEECISNRSSSYVGKQRNLRPEPVLFQEGQSVSLKCILWWVLMTVCLISKQPPILIKLSITVL